MSTDTSSNVELSITNTTSDDSTVYTGESNTVVLTMKNETGSDIVLPAGTPADPVTGSGFTFLVIFDALFGNSSSPCADLTVSATGWAASFFPDAQFPAWAISPTSATTLHHGDTVSIQVSGLKPTSSASIYHVPVDVYNLPGSSAFVQDVPVTVATKKGHADLHDAVGVNLSSSKIDITRDPQHPVQTNLTLTLENLTQDKLVPSGKSWGSVDPSFTLTFTYGSGAPGYFCLTTTDKAANIGVSTGTATSGWHAPSQQSGPSWLLKPEKSTNHEILGTGSSALASFDISNIVTEFTDGPTLLYLEYANIPGYKDGVFVVALEKRYSPMTVGALTANSDEVTVKPGGGAADAYLNWSVSNATMVELSGYGKVSPTETNFPVSLWRTTQFVLTAYDTFLGNIASSSKTVTAIAEQPSGGTESALLTQVLPLGAIVIWSGSIAQVPDGYLVCDGSGYSPSDYPELSALIGTTFGGTAGTSFNVPDLKDRFVRGTGPGATEPVGTQLTPSHYHTLSQYSPSASVTSTNGAHTHAMNSSWYDTTFTSGSYATGIDRDAQNVQTQSFQSDGDHYHSIATVFPANPATDAQSANLRPAWFSLCYLIRSGRMS